MNLAATHPPTSSFPVFAGSNLNAWQQTGLLAIPGGKGPLEHFRQDSLADPIVYAEFTSDLPQPRFGKRWRKAQAAEAQFWRTWRQNTLYKHISLEAFWQEVVEKTGGALPTGKVLDVGCGPVSVLNFCRPEDMQPFGVDPLAEVYARENLIECSEGLSPMPIAGLSAEKLPFVDGALDHVICFNVLDHVSDAPAVLSEIRRVLKPGGSLRVYVHTFTSWIKRFLFFDTPHTYHWDHEEFKHLLGDAGFQVDHELKEPKTFDLPESLLGKLTHFPYWVATKVAYTSYFRLRRD
ncbi:Methyltransferase domain-containing protein [Sulfidibacter corallicola]|uniref:Methyltransferase domain-containing protein n=1 Tax=Sulfidibacter corallicola TaxID=2818388 RepID=A0A8A4TXW8_SULCO|nr:class I SAM-dependent methyltransferase [Sulfidibacter corallicola]QTD54071.1 methyltransferase domain-containing protein [Sulfidibacter corallicola]